MSELKPKIEGCSVVLVGSMNPSIFHPIWFEKHGLIRSKEAESASIEVVQPQISSFSIGPVKIQALPERFMVTTQDAAYYEMIRDLVVGTFGILLHTPVTMMGINLDSHFLASSEIRWHEIGNTLVPKEKWLNLLDRPGLRSVTVEGYRAPDSKDGVVRVRVEPSPQVKPGVFVNVNDHYEFSDSRKKPDCQRFLDELNTQWEPSLQRSRKIAQAMMDVKDASSRIDRAR